MQTDTALTALLLEHRGYLRRFIKSRLRDYHETEEVLQIVWIKAWQNHSKFKGEAKFEYWLCSIAINAVMDYIRGRYRVRILAERELAGFEDVQPDNADVQVTAAQEARILRVRVAKAQMEQRPYIRALLEGKSYKEIAEMHATSVSAVKSIIHRAKRHMQIPVEER